MIGLSRAGNPHGYRSVRTTNRWFPPEAGKVEFYSRYLSPCLWLMSARLGVTEWQFRLDWVAECRGREKEKPQTRSCLVGILEPDKSYSLFHKKKITHAYGNFDYHSTLLSSVLMNNKIDYFYALRYEHSYPWVFSDSWNFWLDLTNSFSFAMNSRTCEIREKACNMFKDR